MAPAGTAPVAVPTPVNESNTLAGATGTAFVAKGELESVPLIGWLSSLNHTVFVARGQRMAVAEQVEQLRRALAAPWPVTIFPEGTTGDGTTLLPFKPALLAALDPPPPGLRVQPVRIDYGDATSDCVWGDESGQVHALRVLRRRGPGWEEPSEEDATRLDEAYRTGQF